MHIPHAMGAGAVLLTLGWFTFAGPKSPPAAESAPTVAAPAPLPPIAEGHLVLVVEGDRNQLAITAAVAKVDPWGGAPKGLTSDWELEVLAADGTALATVPLDLSAFATGVFEQGQPLQVQGCVVRDTRIGMLVSVPAFAAAASYRFRHRTADGNHVVIGTQPSAQIRQLVGGGR
ncbi:MAG: hypothetical protein MUC36_00215 [Planctomycetes bacterium]|jgi:hypothetical protein|nr:hypothetical protein [Planctomycetota bacterium]